MGIVESPDVRGVRVKECDLAARGFCPNQIFFRSADGIVHLPYCRILLELVRYLVARRGIVGAVIEVEDGGRAVSDTCDGFEFYFPRGAALDDVVHAKGLLFQAAGSSQKIGTIAAQLEACAVGEPVLCPAAGQRFLLLNQKPIDASLQQVSVEGKALCKI